MENTEGKPFSDVFSGIDFSEVSAEYPVVNSVARLVVGSQTIECNRMILQDASEVFDKMFSTPMKESGDGIVTIDDVSASMMEIVIKFYQTDLLPNVNDIDHEDMSYIIDKYNFVRINQAIASKVLAEAVEDGNSELCELIYRYYGNDEDKDKAVSNIAELFLADKSHPRFIVYLSPDELMHLTKKLVKILNEAEPTSEKVVRERRTLYNKGMRVSRSWYSQSVKMINDRERPSCERFFNFIKSWLTIDPALRSNCICRILRSFDVREFDFSFVSNFILSLPLQGESGFLLKMLQAALTYFQKEEMCQDCGTPIECGRCKHKGLPPYHLSKKCVGRHRHYWVVNEFARYDHQEKRIEYAPLQAAKVFESMGSEPIACPILGISDIRGLSYDFILMNVVNMPVAGENTIFLEMLGSTLAYFYEEKKCIRCKKEIRCRNRRCCHNGFPPYHSYPNCNDAHTHTCPSIFQFAFPGRIEQVIEYVPLMSAPILQKVFPRGID